MTIELKTTKQMRFAVIKSGEKNKPSLSTRSPSRRSFQNNCCGPSKLDFCQYNIKTLGEAASITNASGHTETTNQQPTKSPCHNEPAPQQTLEYCATQQTTDAGLPGADEMESQSRYPFPSRHVYRQTTSVLSQVLYTKGLTQRSPKEPHQLAIGSMTKQAGSRTQPPSMNELKACP